MRIVYTGLYSVTSEVPETGKFPFLTLRVRRNDYEGQGKDEEFQDPTLLIKKKKNSYFFLLPPLLSASPLLFLFYFGETGVQTLDRLLRDDKLNQR